MSSNVQWKKKKNSYVFLDKETGRELSLEEWNASLNTTNPMRILERHPNPLVVMEERSRKKGILKALGTIRGKRIADIGCEQGTVAQMLVRKGGNVVCVDIDRAMLRQAKKRLGNNAEYRLGNAEKIPLPDSSVDMALSSHTLEHLPEPKKGFAELVRITRPGGIIAVNLPNERVVLAAKRLLRLLGLRVFFQNLSLGLAPGHLHVFDKRLFRSMLSPGVVIERFFYNPPYYTNMFVRLRVTK